MTKNVLGLVGLGLLLLLILAVGPLGRTSNTNQAALVADSTKGVAAHTAILKTNYGEIEVELFPVDAPKTVENFIKLANTGFYDGTLFHRVIKDFMIQGGDPLSREADWARHGTGNPGYTFADEINQWKVTRGMLAMANSGPDTNGSQFFIVTAASAPWLDGKHTVFGRVTKGLEVVDKIQSVPVNENNHPLTNVTLEKVMVK